MNSHDITKPQLFPVFIHREKLKFLVVGNSEFAVEKTEQILNKISPEEIIVITDTISEKLFNLQQKNTNLKIKQKPLEETDFRQINFAFVNECKEENISNISAWANNHNTFICFEKFPEHSNFEPASLLDKGHLKIALYTDNTSPGVSKRITESFNEIVPEQIDELLENLNGIHHHSKEHFHKKVSLLNKISKEFNQDKPYVDPFSELENTTKIVKTARLKANLYLGIIGAMLFVGLFFLTIYEFNLYPDVKDFLNKDHHIFYWMMGVGFLAEMVAGSMGMGYGVICTTILLLLNVPPPVVSASIHSAESFTTAAGSISHFKLKNVNLKLVKRLAPFAIIGALIGAFALTYLGEHYAHIVKPIISFYTLYLGVNIFRKSIRKKETIIKHQRKKSNLTFIGLVGGFIDSFAGGGWGPLVTGSLIKDGRTPRYVVGSSTVTKFILTVASAVTFVFTIGIHHWNIVLGLLLGGVITAPFSAMLTAKLPVKKMTIFISILVIIMSCISIGKALF